MPCILSVDGVHLLDRWVWLTMIQTFRFRRDFLVLYPMDLNLEGLSFHDFRSILDNLTLSLL